MLLQQRAFSRRSAASDSCLSSDATVAGARTRRSAQQRGASIKAARTCVLSASTGGAAVFRAYSEPSQPTYARRAGTGLQKMHTTVTSEGTGITIDWTDLARAWPCLVLCAGLCAGTVCRDCTCGRRRGACRASPAAGGPRPSWRPRAMGEPVGKSVRTDWTDLARAWPCLVQRAFIHK